MPPPLPLTAAVTSAGAGRAENGDRYGIFPRLGLFVVAGGVGVRHGDALMAQVAVDTMREHFETTRDAVHPYREAGAPRLLAGVRLAHRRIAERRCGAGATIAVLSIEGGCVILTHAGDSRVYLVAGGALEQRTEDHTIENELRRHPDITPAERARLPRVLSRLLGMNGDIDLAAQALPLRPGDRYLLCTRGLHEAVPFDEIRAALHAGADLDATVRDLLGRARRREATRDVTCALVQPVPDTP